MCVTVRTNNNNKPQKKEDKLKTTTKNIIHSLFFMFMPSYFCHVMILSYKRFSVVVANQHTLPHFNTHTGIVVNLNVLQKKFTAKKAQQTIWSFDLSSSTHK